MIDIEALLTPIDADSPGGPELSEDLDFLALERAVQRLCVVKREGMVDAQPKKSDGKDGDALANWAAVINAGSALCKRSKDLRIALALIHGLTGSEGVEGLSQGLTLMHGLLDRFWFGLHPIDEDAGGALDILWANNLLATFSDPDGLLGLVRSAALVQARGVGSFRLRDLEIIDGTAAPEPERDAPTEGMLQAAAQGAGDGSTLRRRQAVDASLETLNAIDLLVMDRAGPDKRPEFGTARKLLARAARFFAELPADALEQGSPSETEPGSAASEAHGPGPGAAGLAVPGQLRSRDDARRLLEQVASFLERAEPSHPSPIFIRRAIRLLDLSFVDIMRDLAPDALGRIADLGGLKDEE